MKANGSKPLISFIIILITNFLLSVSSFAQSSKTCLFFNGIDSRVDCKNSILFTPETSITIQIWMKTKEIGGQTVLWRGDVWQNYYGIKTTEDNKIRGTLFLDDYTHIYSQSSIEINKWYHIALTYESNLPDSNFKLYINGNLESALTATGYIKPDNNSLLIGAYPWSNPFTFFGYLEDFQLWNRALSQAEIQEKMNKTLFPQNEQGLVAYWPMTEGEGNIIHDISGNGNNGIIYGAEWFPNNTVHAIINAQSVWIDDSFSGIATNQVDASLSTGENLSYTWSVGLDTLASGINPTVSLPTGSQYLTLTVRNDSGAVSTDSSLISVYAAKLYTKGPIYSAISELDENTFFISSADDRVYQFDSLGNIKWTFLTGGDIQSTVTVSDGNNIFVTSSDTRLYSFNSHGEPNWDLAMGGVVVSSPTFYKNNEILVGLTTGRLFALTYDGKIKWSFQTGDELVASPVISNNGRVYFGSKDKRIYCVSVDGDSLWKYLTSDEIVASPAIGTDHNVVIGSKDGTIYKLNEDGEFLWKFDTNGGVYSAPIIGENGQIFIGSSDGYFYSISKTGDLIWKYNTKASIKSTASISPDGSSIFVGNDAGYIFAFSTEGSVKWYLKTDGPVSAPTLVTKNNLLLASTTYGSVYVMKIISNTTDEKTSTINLEWPTYLGNNQRTGDQQTVITGIKKNEKTINHFELFQNYPNPFNPTTMISFSLLKESRVKITIFNVLGQVINSFNLNAQVKGTHQFKWDGSNLASGIYFYSLLANPTDGSESYSTVKKMLLLK